MESERRDADVIGGYAVIAGQAHRRIDLLLDKVKELTEQRDAAYARTFNGVIAALDGWIEGAQSNHEALGHRYEDSCGKEFHVRDIRAMVEDARRAVVGRLAGFDSVVDHDEPIVQPDADTVRRAADANADAYIDRIDELRAECAQLKLQRGEWMANAERNEALMKSAHESHNKVLGWLRSAQTERDEATTRAEQNREWAERAEARADNANAMVANLRSVLSSIVESIDRQEPK